MTRQTKTVAFFLFFSLTLTLHRIEEADATDSVWKLNPTSSFNNANNWNPVGVPVGATNRAIFDSTLELFIIISGGGPNQNIGRMLFDVNAPAYTFDNQQSFSLSGVGAEAGIVNNSPQQQTFQNNNFASVLSFLGTASIVGNVAITNQNTLTFSSNSSAGSSNITNSGILTFNGNSAAGTATIQNTSNDFTFSADSSAGTATINNQGRITFADNATAGQCTIVDNGGEIFFQGSSTADNATLNFTNLGELIVNARTADLSIGSLSGNGQVFLTDARPLTLGGLGNNDLISNTISQLGSIVKIGTGTLTLSAANTYQGGTTINQGTLSVGTDLNLGNAAAPLAFGGGTLRTTAGIISNRQVTLNAVGTFDTNGFNFTLNGIVSGVGSLTKIGAGTLTLAALNTYTGSTAISEGILQGSLPTNTALTVNNPGAFNLNAPRTIGSLAGTGFVTLNANTLTTGGNNTTTNFSGVISGAGALIKDGAGNLILSGNNTYAGQTTVNAGTLTFTGDTVGLGGNINNAAALVFNQGANSTFTPVITGTGTLTKTGAGNLTLQGANTHSGPVAINGGTLTFQGDTSNITSNIANAAALVFNQAINSTFTPVISGVGTVTKTEAGTLTFTATNTYTGMTTVNQGTLLNNGSLVSAVTVNPGATYAGRGSSGDLTNNGTVSPGNSIGTLTVNGNYTGTGTLGIEVERTGSDLLRVTGTATLVGGSLDVTTKTLFGQPRTFTIVTADGGVIGQFAAAQLPGNFRLSYLPTAVQLLVDSASISFFIPAGEGGNAGIVANYLDAIIAKGTISSDLQTVFDALGEAADQGGSALTDALNQISPDPYREIGYLTFDQTSMINESIHTHQQRLLNNSILTSMQQQTATPVNFDQFKHHMNSRNQRGTLQNLRPKKFTPARQHNQMPGVDTALALSETNLPVRKVVQTGNTSVWMEPYGQLAKKRNSAPLVGTKSDTYGMTMGGDTLVAPKTYVGILGGLINTQFDWTQKRGHGSVKGFYGGAYGLWLSETGIYVDGQVTLGREYIKTRRNIRFQTINRQARETHGGFSVSPALETGYLWRVQQAIIQPFLNWAYTAAYEDSFTEKGANSLNIRSPSKTSQFSRSELGSIFSYFFICNEVLFYPSVQLSWVQRRHIGSQGKGVKFNLTGQTLGTTVFGDNRVRDLFSPGVAFTAQFQDGFYVTTDVKGEVGSGQRSGQLMLEAGYTF